MSAYRREDLEPETLKDIDFGKVINKASGVPIAWGCGCYVWNREDDTIMLCPYHQGFDDAIDLCNERVDKS